MPVLTRKRKAELEATDREAQEQLLTEAEHAAEEPPSKRQKRDDPFKRIDPFRPLSPPPKTVMRRRNQVRLSTLKKRPAKSQHPLPIVFFTVPEANPARQISAKSRSSNDVATIIATNSLFEHVDRYGVEAMPSHQALENWLEENKDKFVQARRQRTREQPTAVRHIQAAPHTVGPTGSVSEAPGVHHPATRPHNDRPVVPVANGGIFRRMARYGRRTIDGFLSRAVTGPDEPMPEEPALIVHISQGNLEHLDHPEHLIQLNRLNQPVAEPTQVRPIVPPLDPRFFHPNGQLHSVYKYLTAQIPLPRQWVRWAITNNITTVPGRGDIRHPGTYIADDTFDYDALYQAVHRGHFRTGRIEIDYHLDHWPGVEGRRDDVVADLELYEFRASPDEKRISDRTSEKSGAPSPEPPPHGALRVSPGRPEPGLPHSNRMYSLLNSSFDPVNICR
ncbi:uncharacterized protein F4807DRAFT_459764 [Annulohypoxylon truncatum]|uniref:uncharacterized protein n=1 Tax=Annulohypoxylon truncatum TaxID=327061 RepID=UPI0020078711|nr:uncharacterized protein F4807DRAFT_459764 [Annulohypoxylon truncatum]KAI1210389.1 hypothetical protein F4807DRAFT_459764 [Annulohypoxylon truncatum]